MGLAESAAEFFRAAWQRCTVHFYRNVFSHVPRPKMREVAAMLKASTLAKTSRRPARRHSRSWESSRISG